MDTAKGKHDEAVHHLMTAERMVAQQTHIVAALERGNDAEAVQEALTLLAALQTSLKLARENLQVRDARQATHELHVRLCGE
jgi:hypothetical protein